MTLTTYAGLKAAVARTLRRSDLTGDIPDFIAMAASDMNRMVRSRRRIERAEATISDEYSAAPSDFGGLRSVRLKDGARTPIVTVSPEQMADLNAGRTAGGAGGALQFVAVVGDELQWGPWPAAAADVEISYYAALGSLSADGDSNWVMVRHPDAFLYGACYHAAIFTKNQEMEQRYGAAFNRIIDNINESSLAESFGGAVAPSASGQVA